MMAHWGLGIEEFILSFSPSPAPLPLAPYRPKGAGRRGRARMGRMKNENVAGKLGKGAGERWEFHLAGNAAQGRRD